MMRSSLNEPHEGEDDVDDGTKSFGDVAATSQRVRGWLTGIVHEMRKKSPATIQKWVDSIATDETDNGELASNQLANTSTSQSEAAANKEKQTILDESTKCSDDATTSASNLKVKLNEICNKLNVNETLKCKRSELKNLIEKKLKMSGEECVTVVAPPRTMTTELIDEQNDDKPTKEDDNWTAQRAARLGAIGRSSSENPRPRNRRLAAIGRSFSVSSNENDPPQPPNDEDKNFIYDAPDEDISITIPSLNTSSTLSNSNNASQNLSQIQHSSPVLRRTSLLQIKPPRQHTVSEGHASPIVQSKNPLLRDSSFQSDSSHCSSVESLLEARKPDAEAILMNLGFGPVKGADDVVSKIPRRFLKPSQCTGVDTDTFLRNQQLSMNIHENSVLGYRGLLGNSHVPSDIVKAIIGRFSLNEMRRMDSTSEFECGRSFKGVAQTVLAQRHFMR